MSEILYKIIREKPLRKKKVVNHVKISSEDLDSCLHTLLYNEDLIRSVLKIIKKHGPEEIEFEFEKLNGPPIVYTADHFPNLVNQWLEAMIESEKFETAALIRDFV